MYLCIIKQRNEDGNDGSDNGNDGRRVQQLLNDRYTQMKKMAEMSKSKIITDPRFFAKVVREYLNERKITKRYQSKEYRNDVIYKAIKHAEYCCAAPERDINKKLFYGEAYRCGVLN